MYYIGLDVHARIIVLCILDECGKCVKRMSIHGPWSKTIDALRNLNMTFDVCYEASTGYGYLHDQLATVARRVVVAHPGKLRLIFGSKRKNDRADAERLAKLLYLGEVPVVHVPSLDCRQWRALVEQRTHIVHQRTAAKNQMRALLRTYQAQPPRQLWTKQGLAWLTALELPRHAALQRDILLNSIAYQNTTITLLEQELDAIAQQHPGVALLQTIPGVGPRTAEAVMAYVDNPARFRDGKSFGCYLGLIPCQDASAGKERMGHITREGPATVRMLLTEAAWQSVRRSPEMKSFFERVMNDDPKRKRIALVAVAHKLSRVMLSMLKSGEAWRAAA